MGKKLSLSHFVVDKIPLNNAKMPSEVCTGDYATGFKNVRWQFLNIILRRKCASKCNTKYRKTK